jgi:hypothetical protein
MRQSANKGIPTTADRRSQLTALVRERGEVGAAIALHISRQTLARAIAGLPIQRGSHALIALRLVELKDEV